MALRVPGIGPRDARVMLVGEAPGFEEELSGVPFVGSSGQELNRMLREAGLPSRESCYITNVSKYRPPDNEMGEWLVEQKVGKPTKTGKPSKAGKKWADQGFQVVNGKWAHPHVVAGRAELLADIEEIKPELIIGFGNTPLWALTGNWGISMWRGSELVLPGGEHFVPTLHPAAILRNWQQRPQVIHDLKQRCAKRLKHGFITPTFDFNIQPNFEEVMDCINHLEGDVVGDIETANGYTICLGLAWSATQAICIPFRGPDGPYWSIDEANEIIQALKLRRGQITWIGQNFNYDDQYLEEDFGVRLGVDFDTYVAQSVLYPGVERKLGYLSSMYCEWHQYWKDDAKDWGRIADFNSLFRYNCRDCCANWEVKQVQQQLLERAGLLPQFRERMKYNKHVYEMMVRGVNRDPTRTEAISKQCEESVHERELFIAEKVGHAVNFDSPKQVGELFYKTLGCKPLGKRTKTGYSTDDDALKKLSEKYPQYAPLALAILESRSLRGIKSNFLDAELEPNGKFRSSWMATGTETFRCTSGGNAFYRGGPLQNVTDGKHTHSGRPLPNLRSCIVPSPGHTIFNGDLERADLQVVAWEADDEVLKDVLRRHGDTHLVNAMELFTIKNLPYEECFPDHPNYEEQKARHEQRRHFAKTFVHGTNYGGKARTMAINANCTVHEADLAQRRWFEAHPGIKAWHQRTQAQLLAFRTVTNRFGYRRIYFERIEGVLPEALAWVPQSTVSILISLIQMAIDDELGDDFETIMQGHDSVIGEYETSKEGILLPRIHAASKIAVPYDDPLYIPLELATSTSSWGEVEKKPWPVS